MKNNLKEYSENELSMHVFNDESLYRMRRNRRVLVEMLNDFFEFTEEQLEVLNSDLDDEERENDE